MKQTVVRLSLAIAVFSLSALAVVSFTHQGRAQAQEVGANVVRHRRPANIVNNNGIVRSIEEGAIAIGENGEIVVGANRPGNRPGEGAQPLAKFSGLNAGFWLNETGPVQITDDAILYGLTDVRIGFINNTPVPRQMFDPRADDGGLFDGGAGGEGHVQPPVPAPAPAPAPVGPIRMTALPAGPNATVAAGINALRVLSVTLQAPAETDIKLNSLTIAGSGTATGTDLSAFQLINELGGQVVGLQAVFPQNKVVTFAMNPGFIIPRGASRTFSVKTNVSRQGARGRTFSFGITRASAVNVTKMASATGGEVQGVFPMNGTVFTIGPAVAQANNILISKLFGVEVAQAAAAVNQQQGGNTLPVQIFDNLLVHGNGAREPGNIIVNGSIIGGQVGLTSQISGNLRVIGGGITVTGSITAQSIGRYTEVLGPENVVRYGQNGEWVGSAISCPAEDQLISCTPYLEDGDPPNNSHVYAKMRFGAVNQNGNDCNARAHFTLRPAAGAPQSFRLRAQAICFSPNGN